MKYAVAWVVALLLQDLGAPLPDSNTFISEFRKTLRSDDELLRNYTFAERETRAETDRSGNPKKTEIDIYQVAPDRGQLYRRLISRNGVPLNQSQLDEEDRDQKMKKQDAPRDDAKIRDELFEIYDIEMQRREMIEGSRAVVLSFRARPGYKPQSKLANFLIHISGRVWVNESDHQLIRLDAEVVDPVSYGWFLGSLDEGTRLIAERRKFSKEVWLPVKLDIQKSQRVLVKGVHLHEVHEYSEHKKVN
jgi:hypothetical protein